MKVALYIEDGIAQVVLTPENEREKAIVDILPEEGKSVVIKHGSFYQCRGGWVRYDRRETDYSVMLVVADPEVKDG